MCSISAGGLPQYYFTARVIKIMMSKRKVLIVAGTRPEVIKLAPVIHELSSRRKAFITRICLTGQHREMVEEAIHIFGIRSHYTLNVMAENQSLSHLTATIIDKIGDILDDFKPHLVLVQGDTTSAFVAALAGFYRKVQIGHVEAGLRTHNKYSPFPEEMNRVLISALANHHFAPTVGSKRALQSEGIDKSKIIVTGNTVVDALLYILEEVKRIHPSLGGLEKIVGNGQRTVLITGHRRESFGKGFENICNAIRSLARKFKNCNFVYPVHLNPRVQEPVFRILSNVPNIHLVGPMGYLSFVRLMNLSYVILTDSGGIQEEAPTLGKPVVVMRDATERTEAVEAGSAILVGTDKSKIVREVTRLLSSEKHWSKMTTAGNPYGDGKAAKRIGEYLEGAMV